VVNAAAYIERAERILDDRFSYFALRDCQLGQPPQWNRDPLTGVVGPLVPASSLDYRDERLVGNIKYLWEPNRHLHLPALAQAYALTHDHKYTAAIAGHISSWIDQCPRGRGANWSSSLELGIRLINWSITWQLLGGWHGPLFRSPAGEELRERWLASVYQHVRAIMGKLSRYSSANNHLIGEVAGAWIASVTWPHWPQMRKWGARAKRILAEQALEQNAPDGGNREQAFSYQQFVLDFLVLAGLAARAARQDFAPTYWQRIERMLEFLAALMDTAGNMPMVGDADDGFVVDLGARSDNYRSLLATGAVLFDRVDFARKSGGLDEKTRWLLGARAEQAFDEFASMRAPVAPQRRAFPESGYYVLGDRFDTPEEVRMLVDAGPLGFLSIAAHGHADALSVVLNVAGQEVLVDPGTYAYHTQPEWRRYFRSTAAHNTLELDGVDQSQQSGNFMWSRHAEARCTAFDVDSSIQRFVGEHDGYRRLDAPAVHRREITYDTGVSTFEIVDRVATSGEHRAIRRWHFAETLKPVVSGSSIEVTVGSYRVRIESAEADTEATSVVGGTAVQGGWVSRRFDVKVPATTVCWQNPVRGDRELRTTIRVAKLGS
jgi:hypothetical protein